MTETPVCYEVLKRRLPGDTMDRDGAFVVVPRKSLETEHRHLLGRLHELRELLGLPPLQTGKKQRQLK